jgi:hypothetical protein
MHREAKSAEETKLLRNIKDNLHSLDKLLQDSSHSEDDLIYRFYHQSFKVYGVQFITEQIIAKFQELAPHLTLNDWFMEIVRQGTGRKFSPGDNANWTAITRPMLEAFFHTRYFLRMICQYGRELQSPPQVLPSGWAAVLYLYNLR